jgi:hypothetical protein
MDEFLIAIKLSLFLWGVAAVFDEDMVFGFVGKWLEARVHIYLLKPTIYCPACMSSVWGTATALYLSYSVEQWLTLVFTTCGINYIIMRWLTK